MAVCSAQSVQCLVAEQAARAPDARALIDARRHMTYAALDGEARALAARLHAAGAGPEQIVAIALDRSCELVIAMVATLYAGAAYLPLDPTLPTERLAWMLADSGAQLIVTTSALCKDLPLDTQTVLLLDDAPESPVPWQPRPTQPAGLAYMIYTSGSTGRPKGALLTQGGLRNLALEQARIYGVSAQSRLLQLVSPSFDVATGEIFTALVAGASLVLPRADLLGDPAAIAEALRAHSITHVSIPPAILALIPPMDLPALQTVITGGEPCPPEVAARWAARCAFFNAYGPTETTVTTTIARIDAEAGTLPIGTAIANTQTYRIGEKKGLANAPDASEMYISGAGVGRGYHNQPALTAERFLPNPYSPTPGARMYRTGDLVREREDGQLEFLGRVDEQIKLRGLRIELGEIEQALAAHPAVRQSAVALLPTESGHHRLAGYLVAADPTQPPGELIRAARVHLLERLPAYMVPAAWALLEALPLMASGKIDRRALPAPTYAAAAQQPCPAPPRSALEALLADIWASVLGLAEVGRDTAFADLGGDSILSIEVAERAAAAGLYLRPQQLFAHPTIAELAPLIATTPPERPAIELATGPAPLLPSQAGFFERASPRPDHWNGAEAVVAPPNLDVRVLGQAVTALLAHHEALRLRFYQDSAGAWHQEPSACEAAPPLWVIDLGAVAEDGQQAALAQVAAAAQRSLSLEAGRLLRVVFLRLGPGAPGRLLIVAHHLVMDAVSWRILLEDLSTAYGQLTRGEPLALPTKTSPLQAWARRLADHAHSRAILAELDHWADPSRADATVLPIDHERGPNIVASGRRVKASLRYDETQLLVHELPAVFHVPAHSIVAYALAQVLARWAGRRQVLINLRGHGRDDWFTDLDVTRTVGWFTTLAPVLFSIDGSDASDAALQAINAQIVAAAQTGAAYGLLRYLATDSQVRERRSALVKAEVNFNYLGQHERAFVSDLSLGPAPEGPGPLMSPDSPRAELLDVVARIGAGRLRLTWNYSAARHREETIAALAQAHLAALRQLIAEGAARLEAHPIA